MKNTLFYLTLAFSIIGFTSCSKDSESVEPAFNPVGLYIGTYNVVEGAENADSLYYSFFLRSDSVLQVQGVGADGNTYYKIGRWSLQGRAFSATVATTNLSQTGVKQVIAGELTDSTLKGTVQNGAYLEEFMLRKTN